jgi:hypothetical protein
MNGTHANSVHHLLLLPSRLLLSIGRTLLSVLSVGMTLRGMVICCALTGLDLLVALAHLNKDVIPWRIRVTRVVSKLYQSIRSLLELATLGLLKGDGGKIDFAAAQARVVLLVKNGCNFHVVLT